MVVLSQGLKKLGAFPIARPDAVCPAILHWGGLKNSHGEISGNGESKSKDEGSGDKGQNRCQRLPQKRINTKAVAEATKEQKVEDTQEKDTQELTEKNVGKHNVDTLIQKLKS